MVGWREVRCKANARSDLSKPPPMLGTPGGAFLSDQIACLIAWPLPVSINSAALNEPSLITQIADRYGSQAVVVAIDAGDGVVHTHGGRVATATPTLAWAVEAAARGAGEILLTSIRHDGHRTGYDLELTSLVRDAVPIPVIASGGAGCAEHVAHALRVADAALVASIVHENPSGFAGLREQIERCGIALRPVKDHYE